MPRSKPLAEGGCIGSRLAVGGIDEKSGHMDNGRMVPSAGWAFAGLLDQPVKASRFRAHVQWAHGLLAFCWASAGLLG